MVLAIDPSINDVGLALVDTKGQFKTSWHIKTPQKVPTPKKIEFLVQEMESILNEIDPSDLDYILIEHTRFFARANNSSHAAAQKLNLAKGTLFGACRSLTKVPVHLVWIPGFNKQQAQWLARSFKLPQKITQHEIDAFWLGNTWINTSEPIKKSYLEQAEL